jgi:nucleoside-diphosphate kinase
MQQENVEQTLVLIKPDALKNSLTGYILLQLSEYHTGLRYAGTKIVSVNNMIAEEHYAEHKGKVFYPALIEYICGCAHYPNEPWKRRVKAFVFHGPEAVTKIRTICGPTNPHVAREQDPGCIRALGTVVPLKDASGKVIGERMDNLIHASANQADAEREIKLWFKPNDIPPAMRTFGISISEDHYYYKGGKLFSTYEPGTINLISPGDVVWKSDLEALELLSKGQKADHSIDSIAAKYLINYI